jgi:DNA-binding NtrC family response regulator/tetratricopeptide (TPR) repeat protein
LSAVLANEIHDVEETGCVHAREARARLAEGRHAEALLALRQARRRAPATQAAGLVLKESEALFGLSRYRDALGLVTRAIVHRPVDDDVAARLHIVRSQALWMTGRVAPARNEVERAARKAGAPLTEARVRETLGLFAWKDQDVDGARAHLASARDLYAGQGSLQGQVRTLEKEGGLLRDMGRWREALGLQSRRLEMAAQSGRIDQVALARSDRGALLASLGRWSEARHEIDRAADLFHQLGDAREVTVAGLHRVVLDLAAGDLAGARGGLLRARQVEAELGNPRSLVDILTLTSDVELAAGAAEAADQAASEALTLLSSVGDRGSECSSRVRRVQALIALGQLPEALREARRAVRLAPPRPDLTVMAQLSLGRALLRTGRAEARSAFERAIAAGRAGSGLVHAAALGLALAKGEDASSEDVRAALRGLEDWGDRRLSSFALADVRAFIGCRAWAPTEGRETARASAVPAGSLEPTPEATALVDAAMALEGEGEWSARWAGAMRAVRPVLSWWRAAIVGPQAWELRGDMAAPARLSEDDLARLLTPGEGPTVFDLRAETACREHPTRVLHGLATALVTPAGVGAVLYVDRRDDQGPLTPRDGELLRQLARLVAAHPAETRGDDEAQSRFPEIVGRCPGIERLFTEMGRVAGSEVPVHIFGETGTGKERVARALHHRSPRARGPFVALNASSLSDELFEAELFGHARGAFTGAVTAREGHVAAAEGGTLFIDEVADLSPRTQAKLLRFLQEGEYRRLGESVVRKANVRVLSAANVVLEERVAAGRFREDLLYRLNVVTLELPPLRERGDDVLLLARHFVRAAAEKAAVPPPRLPSEVAAVLAAFSWPGNVRQLENEMSRLVALAGGGPLRKEDLSPRLVAPSVSVGSSLRAAQASFERDYIARALARNGGHRGRTAAELGITRQALVEKIRKLGL